MTELEEVQGIGAATAKKLQRSFITTAELLAVQNPLELASKSGIGEGTAKNIVDSARGLVGGYDFVSGLEFEEKMKSAHRLRTGLPQLDNQLRGGLMEGSVVEIYGPARGGKTQWCSHLATRVQLSFEEGGLEGGVLWLDTESSFNPAVIRANARRWGLDPEMALGNIRRAEVVVSGQIESLFDTIPKLCAEQNNKLVVVDSLSGLYRVEFSGIRSLAERQAKLNTLLNRMRRAGKATKTVFLYTNQATTGMHPKGGGYTKPVGGHILAHGSDYRFYASAKSDDTRYLSLKDNASIPQFKSTLKIGWGGFYKNGSAKNDTEPNILEYMEQAGLNTEVGASGEEEQ
ncbi:MAG: ATPase domain-containing protein [Candidatus Thorarchaeota archaeon]